MRWHSYHRASQKQARKGSPLVKKEASPKKQKEKELPNTPFNFGVIPISLLLLVLPHICLAKTFLLLFNNFIHSHTHTCIHTYKTRPRPTTTQKGIIHPFCSIEHTQNTTKRGVVYNNNNNPDRNNQPHAREFCTTYLTNYSHSFTMMVV
jgi:hypothetical protein